MKTVTNFARLALAFILTGAIGYAKDEPYLRANHKILGHEVQAYQQHAQDRAQTLYYYFA